MWLARGWAWLHGRLYSARATNDSTAPHRPGSAKVGLGSQRSRCVQFLAFVRLRGSLVPRQGHLKLQTGWGWLCHRSPKLEEAKRFQSQRRIGSVSGSFFAELGELPLAQIARDAG